MVRQAVDPRRLKASLLLSRDGVGVNFEVLPIGKAVEGIVKEEGSFSLLALHKVTETGSPFIVIAGYFLRQTKTEEGGVLAEFETVHSSDYSKLKKQIREMLGGKINDVPITFW